MQLTITTARTWVDRWDLQQDNALPDREAQFAVIADAVAANTDRPDPTVIDLACGVGSLGAQIRRHLPDARIIGVDADPLLLALARATDDAEFVDFNLDDPEWVRALPVSEPVDAIVSATALHWLRADSLARVYLAAVRMLRPGGLLLNADDMIADSATIDRLDLAIASRRIERSRQPGVDDWANWWAAIESEPEFAAVVAERRTRVFDRPDEHEPPVDLHFELCRRAGFSAVGQIWQYGRSRVIAAVR